MASWLLPSSSSASPTRHEHPRPDSPLNRSNAAATPAAMGRPCRQRPTGYLHPGYERAVRVLAKNRVVPSKAGEGVHRNKPLRRQDGVVGHRAMTLGEQKPVTGRIDPGPASPPSISGHTGPIAHPAWTAEASSCFSSPVISLERPGRSSYDIVGYWRLLIPMGFRRSHGTTVQLQVHLKSTPCHGGSYAVAGEQANGWRVGGSKRSIEHRRSATMRSASLISSVANDRRPAAICAGDSASRCGHPRLPRSSDSP